ncbi:MAG: alpha/beta hydrolase [Chloroflexi bacterium]|nr:alpha/beta hydrolase [Chloroflexota bacterium]MDA1145613.1 alpha/beta hydrolase [Chloroflexota bacterium]
MTTSRATLPVPGFDIAESDVAYANPGDTPLLARIYRPTEPAADGYPVAVAVHGGAWNANDRTVSELANRTLASSGIVVVAIDFRQGPDHQHPSASSDIVAAVRWSKLHAAEYGGNPETVGLIGSSSGGHLALLAAIRPHAPEHQTTPVLDGQPTGTASIDGTVRYVVANWPVCDPLYRYRYAVRMQRDQLIASHLAYFVDEPTMKAASVPRILDDGEAQELPPLLLVQPGEDQNVPLEMTQYLMRAYQKRGGHLEYAFFPGEHHAFTYEPSDATADCLALVADFVHRRTS